MLRKISLAVSLAIGAISVIALGIAAISYLQYSGARKYEPAKEMAENRSEATAKVEFDNSMRKLERQRKQIGDAAFNRAYAHERNVLAYRTRAAKNPEVEGCNFGIDVRGNVRVWRIPQGCADTGIQFTVWPDASKKTVRTEFLAEDGACDPFASDATGCDSLGVTPTFTAGRGSTADCNESAKTCEFEGNVYHLHPQGKGKRILRITVE